MLVAGVDILAHPGLITKDDALLAAEKGIPLEITSRKGHSLTNGHVAAMARETGATLVLNNDAHSPADLIDERMKRTVGLGAGMTPGEYDQIEQTTLQLIARVKERLEKEE
jgi:histidinol phosphatase-like PHP family hydrolase